MKFKKIFLILLLIVILPALFYTVYEYNSLSENEKLITEIYDQQLNAILYSVNQYSWDHSNSWVNKLNLITDHQPAKQKKLYEDFLAETPAVEALFVTDSTLNNLNFIISTNQNASTLIRKADLVSRIKEEQDLLNRLIYRKKLGYSKIESISLSANDQSGSHVLSLIFISGENPDRFKIVGIILNANIFIRDVLQPKMNEYAGKDLAVGIFKEGENEALFSTGQISLGEARLTKKIWLFPEHILGVKLEGTAIEDLASSRFYQSLQLILLLNVVIIITAGFLYRSVRREMDLARIKSDFVSNVSHELRTPLALIRMFAETLEMDRVRSDEKRKEYYRIITQETERLTHLINNILDFSKMEAGKKQYNFRQIDLNDCLDHICSLYKFHLENKGFSLNIDRANKKLLISADNEAVCESLINLIDNAMKYSEDQKEVTLRTGVEKNSIFIEVADKGIGISENDQKRVFEKFFRVTSGLTHNTKGSGLGLALVEFTMKAHLGRVSVKSSPGRGSRFRLSFPLKIDGPAISKK